MPRKKKNFNYYVQLVLNSSISWKKQRTRIQTIFRPMGQLRKSNYCCQGEKVENICQYYVWISIVCARRKLYWRLKKKFLLIYEQGFSSDRSPNDLYGRKSHGYHWIVHRPRACPADVCSLFKRKETMIVYGLGSLIKVLFFQFREMDNITLREETRCVENRKCKYKLNAECHSAFHLIEEWWMVVVEILVLVLLIVYDNDLSKKVSFCDRITRRNSLFILAVWMRNWSEFQENTICCYVVLI